MRAFMMTAVTASFLSLAGATPGHAMFGGGGGGGSSGGDREPAGGAFMSSYVYPGSTGIQRGGPPRSVDIPEAGYRGYHHGRGPYGYAPRYRQPGW